MEDPGTKRPPKLSLGEELQVTSVTPDSVGLSWMVPEGQFDSFVVQYKDKDGRPQVVPVGGSSRAVIVSGLDPAHRYQLLLYGLREDKRVGPLSAIAVTGECGCGQNTLFPLPTRLSWPDPATQFLSFLYPCVWGKGSVLWRYSLHKIKLTHFKGIIP